GGTVTVVPGTGFNAILTAGNFTNPSGSVLFRGTNLGGSSGTFSRVFLTGQSPGFISGALPDTDPNGSGPRLAVYDVSLAVRPANTSDYYTNPARIIQNAAPTATPLNANVRIEGAWQTQTAAQTNTVASLIAAAGGSLLIQNTLQVSSGTFFQEGGSAVYNG